MKAGISFLETLFWYLSILAYLVLLVRLYKSGLAAKYKNFTVFLGVEVVQSVSALVFSLWFPKYYGYMALVTSPAAWVAYILVVLELFGLVFKDYRGVTTVSKFALRVILGTSLVIALLSLFPEMHESARHVRALAVFSLVERGVVTSLVAFLLMIAGALLWYPIPLKRNAIIHTALFSIYFLAIAAGLFFRDTLGFELTRAVSTATLAFVNVCLGMWFWFLRQPGEATQMVVRKPDPEEAARLLQQLESINAVLLRSYRK